MAKIFKNGIIVNEFLSYETPNVKIIPMQDDVLTMSTDTGTEDPWN